MIGHNGGPTMEAGAGWRAYAWKRARNDTLPKMPLEIIRLRVNRAKELGIDFKSYASIRAGTGRDVIALLFSSNALRVGPKLVTLPEAQADKLGALKHTQRLAAVHRPLTPELITGANAALIEAAAQAPTLADGWRATREKLAELTSARGLPSDAVLVIGDTALEAEWATAGRMAGYLPAEAYFGAA
ncbi:MAG: hypothetical protein P8X43_01520 [Maritimibacter sp.]